MKVALLGASSQIAKGLLKIFIQDEEHQMHLFTRDLSSFQQWIESNKINSSHLSANSLEAFNHKVEYDLIINFIGIGDPSKAINMGASIFDITYDYDHLVLNYLSMHPKTKYIFMSSGVVYGDIFEHPASMDSKAIININSLQHTDWYAMAKLYAEARHRALKELCIIDIRVFNYISSDIDIESRFLISDALRAIDNKEILKTNDHNIFRDYIGPEDLHQLILRLIDQPFLNTSVDCFTSKVTDKFSILELLRLNFGLQYEVVKSQAGIDAYGSRDNYFSINQQAGDYGYKPLYTSLENIFKASEELLI